ncbi:MAG: apolipoprotein N-acyltransferase, partial [Sphingomicrobium sp.]
MAAKLANRPPIVEAFVRATGRLAMAVMKLVLFALLTGAASALAFEPVGWWPLIFVAFALLCELLNRASGLRNALAIGWAFGFGQFVVGLNWIATAFTFQAAMPPALGWVAVVLVSIYLAVFPALASGIAWRFHRENRLVLLLLLAGTWAISEWLRGTLFTGFPWNPVAAAIVPTPLIGISPLTGTYGLGALVILLGGAVWLEYYRRWLPMVVIFAITILLWLLPSSPVPADPLAVTQIKVVQPNIGQDVKWRPGTEAEAMGKLTSLTGVPGGEPRLILWPEAAVTLPLQDRRDGASASAEAQARAAASVVGPEDILLTGGLSINSADGTRVDSATNSVFVIGPGGKIIGRYDKSHLVPFGEYLPMRPVLSSLGLARLAPGDIDFASGPGPRTIDVGRLWGPVGFQLCYEIIFSGRVVDQTHRPSF